MITLIEFIERINYDMMKYKYVHIKIGPVGIIGTRTIIDDSFITIEDVKDAIIEADIQFGYDENDNLVDPMGMYNVISYIPAENNGLIIYINKD